MIHLDTEQSRNPLAFPGRRSGAPGERNASWDGNFHSSKPAVVKTVVNPPFIGLYHPEIWVYDGFNHNRDFDAKRQDISRLLIHLEDAQPSGLSGSPRSLMPVGDLGSLRTNILREQFSQSHLDPIGPRPNE